jgi:hypothetical protein
MKGMTLRVYRASLPRSFALVVALSVTAAPAGAAARQFCAVIAPNTKCPNVLFLRVERNRAVAVHLDCDNAARIKNFPVAMNVSATSASAKSPGTAASKVE